MSHRKEQRHLKSEHANGMLRAALRRHVQARVLLYELTMTPNDSSYAALTAVLSEVSAKVCRSCQTQAAVRVGAGVHGGDPATRTDPVLLKGDVWFCFECGHEEPAVD